MKCMAVPETIFRWMSLSRPPALPRLRRIVHTPTTFWLGLFNSAGGCRHALTNASCEPSRGQPIPRPSMHGWMMPWLSRPSGWDRRVGPNSATMDSGPSCLITRLRSRCGVGCWISTTRKKRAITPAPLGAWRRFSRCKPTWRWITRSSLIPEFDCTFVGATSSPSSSRFMPWTWSRTWLSPTRASWVPTSGYARLRRPARSQSFKKR